MAYIAVDFDNTCVVENFPHVGADIPECVRILNRLVASGHKLILLTQRERVAWEGVPDILALAISWFEERDIPLYAVNDNPIEYNKYYQSKKVYADVIIDDHCAGIPMHGKCVNWIGVEQFLIQAGYFE